MIWLRCRAVHLFALSVAAVFLASNCQAQLGPTRVRLATIDEDTRWAFRTRSPVKVSSPIIRLGDVVKPLDPNMVGWKRLSRAPIGLLPLGGQSMMIQRNRLAQAVQDAEATPVAIDWIGPTEIEVVYDPSAQPEQQVATTSHVSRVSASSESVVADRVTPTEARRIRLWITHMLERDVPSVPEIYRVTIDEKQIGFSRLRRAAGVASVQPVDDVAPGTCRFHVVGRSLDGPINCDIEMVLEKHPTVAVSRTSLSRGHRIRAGDLVRMPLPQEKLVEGLVIDPEEAVGLEVHNTIRANQPILQRNLGAPILIHRGALIDIRVVGGGVTVTTSAKALRDGAASELIEVEILQTRRRIAARVLDSSTVEIVTRPTQVTP